MPLRTVGFRTSSPNSAPHAAAATTEPTMPSASDAAAGPAVVRATASDGGRGLTRIANSAYQAAVAMAPAIRPAANPVAARVRGPLVGYAGCRGATRPRVGGRRPIRVSG